MRKGHPVERLCGIPDLTLTRQEDKHITGRGVAFGPQLLDGLTDAGDLVPVVIWGLAHERPVAHLDGIGAPGHLDDGSVVEMLRESLRVNGRRGDDDLEVRAARQQLLEVPQDEVDAVSYTHLRA